MKDIIIHLVGSAIVLFGLVKLEIEMSRRYIVQEKPKIVKLPIIILNTIIWAVINIIFVIKN